MPLLIPAVVLLSLVVLQLHPSLGTTLSNRLTGHLSSDPAVVERQREYDAMIHGLSRDPLLGFGFGRPVSWLSTDGTVHTGNGDLENSYAWILAGGGACALGALVVLILAFFRDAFGRLRGISGEARALVIFSLSFVFVLLVNALAGPILSDSTFALSLWVALLLPATVRTSSGQPHVLPGGSWTRGTKFVH